MNLKILRDNEGKRRYTYKYWRFFRLDRVRGIWPLKKLLERSSVLSFESLPSSEGKFPVMLLFCRSLQNSFFLFNKTRIKKKLPTWTIFILTQAGDLSSFLCLVKEFLINFGLELLCNKTIVKWDFINMGYFMLGRICILASYRPVTRPSGEQVIIVQLHGSTAVASQLRTLWGSFNEPLIFIKATTVKEEIFWKICINHLFVKNFKDRRHPLSQNVS